MDLYLLIDYMKFAGNGAGDPYHYANGGIWPHGNACYALALINNGLNKDAF
jgi:glycogen debranching enzyme